MLSSRDVSRIPRCLLNIFTPTAGRSGIAREDGRPRHGAVVLALIGMVIVLDQTVKWWAWRHVPHTVINSGGDILVGRTIGAWYSGRISGAVLDVLDVGLLSIVVWTLARRRVSGAVRVTGALMAGGWTSNLLDRLGIHYWTAPGSVRGVVDFMHIGSHYYNVADLFIISCTPLFALAAGYQLVRTRIPVSAWGNALRLARGRTRMRVLALAGTGLIVAVALGAVNDGGVNAAPRAPARVGARPAPQPVSPCSSDNPQACAAPIPGDGYYGEPGPDIP
jgi:lipoprotein signal peptidase